ncbi:minichromosome maintenance protein MCM [Halomicrobium salinisoli]|uniref:minichromosome maintenance protein MCM n=1 Tax=Halomicrobium salinisoli TaxID=2878391 RepID=UPI001CEFDCFB|nr:minichromosome maintenance protein MCM [Halomicrobium salinisoli]
MTTQHELIDRLIELYRKYYREEVGHLAEHYPQEQQSLHVDYADVFRLDPEIADDLINHPEKMLRHFEEALALFDLPIQVDLSDAHVRVYNLPESLDVSEVSRHNNIGRLLDVRGQVSKVSKVKPKVVEASFECQRCGTITDVPQVGENFQEPHQCQGCERQGPFELEPSESEWINHQYMRLQQPPERTSGGNAQSVDVHLQNDLTDEVQAGDRVTLTGTLDIEVPGSEQTTTFDTEIDGCSVVREESDYEDIGVDKHLAEIKRIANGERGDPYELLVDSINPKHQGDETVKLAIALQLFGGWAHEHPDGSRDRGDSHILLLGDPGCGKSTFLRAVDQLAPRSTYASGKGASKSGMTAAAVPDEFGDREWGLEAGALVLADGGMACVDEIDKMQPDAVSSMHGALESQQVHVNKAGINATLNARTALLAAGNPENGRFESFRPKAEQIDLSPTLMSRFDLMFMVSDNPDEDRDREVIDHMIRSRRAAAKHTLGGEMTDDERDRVEPAISPDVLRAYIAHAKETCFPILEDGEAAQRLREYFVSFRNANQDDDNPVPITYRQEQAIERLAEASARVRLSDTVELEDVERAVDLVETSMRQVGYDPETDQFDVDMIETGQSKSQRERRERLLDWIEENNGVTSTALVEDAADQGLDPDAVEDDVRTLLDDGRIYELDGVLRVT